MQSIDFAKTPTKLPLALVKLIKHLMSWERDKRPSAAQAGIEMKNLLKVDGTDSGIFSSKSN